MDEKIPYGIAGIDFPLTLYDRPQLALSNLLLRGDIDAATRSLLAPQTLTPTEMQTFRSALLKGRKNPFLKTIVDVTTNPVFIIGAIMAFGIPGLMKGFPLVGVKPLQALYEGTSGAVKAMGPYSSYIHSAFTNLRNVPGLIKKLAEYVGTLADYEAKYVVKLDRMFREAGRLPRLERLRAAALREGWNTTKSPLWRLLSSDPEFAAELKAMGPIAPGLQRKMSPAAIKLSGRMGKWLDSIADSFPKEVWMKASKLRNALKLKGWEIGQRIKNYFPHGTYFNRYERLAQRASVASSPQSYADWVDRTVEYAVGRPLRVRTWGGMPAMKELRMLEEAGDLHPDFMPLLNRWLGKRRAMFARGIGERWKAAAGNVDKFVKDVGEMMNNPPWNMDMTIRLGKRDAANTLFRNMFHLLKDASGRGAEAMLAELNTIADHFALPPEYLMDPYKVLPRYLHAVAPTFAWHMTGKGTEIMKTIRGAGPLPAWQTRYLMDNLLPLLRGIRTRVGFEHSVAFGEQKYRIFTWLRDHPMLKKLLPPTTHKMLLDYFAESPGAFNLETIGSRIAHWFYLSTLGMPNLSPSIKNLGQTWITTANVIGLRGMKLGFEELLGPKNPRLLKYFSYLTKGVGHAKAFKLAFPELVKEMKDAGHFIEQMTHGDIMQTGHPAIVAVGSMWEKIKRVMMTPFVATESFNWLLSFYGTRATALADGIKPAMAGQLGRVMVGMTQFPGGPLNMPRMLLNLPVPFRQFMHFPLRFLGFLHSSLRWGADPNKLHWGTIARALMGSTAAYYAVKNMLGMDISQQLLFGALPAPVYPEAPFYPSPFVPPVIGTAGSLLAAVHSGEPKYLQTAWPLLVPGGLGIRRLYRTLAPRYADYQNRTEDGRIPVYNRERALVGTYSPFELFMRASGLNPVAQSSEWAAAEWLLKQREKVRRYRREYLDALSKNDLPRAQRVQEDFKKAYPELAPLQVKKSDITAIHNRMEISRLHRIMRGFPKAYRPLFERVAGEAMMARIFEDLEKQPVGLLDQYAQMFAAPGPAEGQWQ